MSCRVNLLNNQPSVFPFLSETRTLPSRSFQRPQTRPFLQPPRRHFSTTKCSLVDVEDRNIDDHVPPEPPTWSWSPPKKVKTFHFHPTQSSTSAPPTRSRPDEQTFRFGPTQSDPSLRPSRPLYDSTITASEQAVFNRIFADITSSNNRGASKDIVKTEPTYDAEAFTDLDTIFNNALNELEERTERIELRKAALAISSSTPIVRGIARSQTIVRRPLLDIGIAGFIQGWPQDAPGLSSYRLEMEEKADWNYRGVIGLAHDQYCNKLDGLLRNAQTDVELWQILENEVFGLVHELNARIRKAEKTNQTKPRKATKARTALTSPPPSEENENLTHKLATGKTHIYPPMLPASLPPTILLSILQTEYPVYLYKTLRVLQVSFPTSPFALRVLPTVRRLGRISYILGTSTKLYNRTLLSMWKQEGNLHAIADLLNEMYKMGVETDQVTLAFLTGLKQIRKNALAGHNGIWTKNWWSMGSEQEGWQRIAQGLERCREEAMAQEAEMSREEKELDDKEQEQNK